MILLALIVVKQEDERWKATADRPWEANCVVADGEERRSNTTFESRAFLHIEQEYQELKPGHRHPPYSTKNQGENLCFPLVKNVPTLETIPGLLLYLKIVGLSL